jgi:nitroreductase
LEIPKVILERKSVRAYSHRELSKEDIETLVRAGCQAPSAGNLQPWAFIAVTDQETKQKLVEATRGQSFIAESSVVIVVCVEPSRTAPRYGDRGTGLYCFQDSAAAIENILITATHNGLGSCWIGAFDESKASKALELPSEIRPVAMIPVGPPAQTPTPRPRRSLAEVLHWDRW